MKRFSQLVLVAAIVVVTATVSQAQQDKKKGPRGGGFGGFPVTGLSLLAQKSVQDELKMSEDQVKTVTEKIEKQRGAARDPNLSREDRAKKREEQVKADQKAIAELLKPEQLKRFKQISLQQQGLRAVGNAETADALKLSSEQKEKVKTIQEDSRKELTGLFQPGGNREEAVKKMAEIRKATDEKLTKVLSDDQKSKLKELQGETFKGEIKRPEGRRRPQPKKDI